MQAEHRTHSHNDRKIAPRHGRGQAMDTASLLALPAIIATAVGWRAFMLLGDLPLSIVLGCTAFVTIAPSLASTSNRSRARRNESR